MRRLDAFKKLAERGISYAIKRIRKKFKNRFIAFIVYGSFVAGDLTINSDIDCLAIIEGKKGEFNSWYCNFLPQLGRWLANKPESKVFENNNLPVLNIYAETTSSFKKRLKDGEPLAIEIFYLGEIRYPPKGKQNDFFRFDTRTLSKRQFMKLTFENDVKNLLEIHARQFVKKCLLVGRRLCLMEGWEKSSKEQTARKFDELFPGIAGTVSLTRLTQFFRQDLNSLGISGLVRIISECNSFLLEAEQFSRRKWRRGKFVIEA